MTQPRYSAAREYKQIIAGIIAAADGLRERDRERAAELTRYLVGLEDEMRDVERKAVLVRLAVELHWEAALEALWVESWMTLRPRPGPDPHADPVRVDEYLDEIERRSAELQEAVRRRRFGLPGR